MGASNATLFARIRSIRADEVKCIYFQKAFLCSKANGERFTPGTSTPNPLLLPSKVKLTRIQNERNLQPPKSPTPKPSMGSVNYSVIARRSVKSKNWWTEIRCIDPRGSGNNNNPEKGLNLRRVETGPALYRIQRQEIRINYSSGRMSSSFSVNRSIRGCAKIQGPQKSKMRGVIRP